jgi:hypothetical protein
MILWSDELGCAEKNGGLDDDGDDVLNGGARLTT